MFAPLVHLAEKFENPQASHRYGHRDWVARPAGEEGKDQGCRSLNRSDLQESYPKSKSYPNEYLSLVNELERITCFSIFSLFEDRVRKLRRTANIYFANTTRYPRRAKENWWYVYLTDVIETIIRRYEENSHSSLFQSFLEKKTNKRNRYQLIPVFNNAAPVTL